MVSVVIVTAWSQQTMVSVVIVTWYSIISGRWDDNWGDCSLVQRHQRTMVTGVIVTWYSVIRCPDTSFAGNPLLTFESVTDEFVLKIINIASA